MYLKLSQGLKTLIQYLVPLAILQGQGGQMVLDRKYRHIYRLYDKHELP